MDIFINSVKTRPITMMVIGSDNVGCGAIFSFVEYVLNEMNSLPAVYLCDHPSIRNKFSVTTRLASSKFVDSIDETIRHAENHHIVGLQRACIVDTIELVERTNEYQRLIDIDAFTVIRLIKVNELSQLNGVDLNMYDYVVMMPAIDFMTLLNTGRKMFQTLATYWDDMSEDLSNTTKQPQTPSSEALIQIWKYATLRRQIVAWKCNNTINDHISFKIE